MKSNKILRCFLTVGMLAICASVNADETTGVKSTQDTAVAPVTPPCKLRKEAALNTITPLDFEPVTEWLAADQRTELECLEVGFTDQDGRKGHFAAARSQALRASPAKPAAHRLLVA